MNNRLLFIVAVALTSVPITGFAQALFWTKEDLPAWDGYPATTHLECTPDNTLCHQRVVVQVLNGKYHHSRTPPKCMADDSVAAITQKLATSGAAAFTEGGPHAAAVDYLKNVGIIATERGIIKGEVGDFLAGISYDDKTGRCVAVCAAAPQGARAVSGRRESPGIPKRLIL